MLAATQTLVMVAGIEAGLLTARLRSVDVALPSGAPGETWVVVGSDSRAELPDRAPLDAFGSVEEVPGRRADVVLVVHHDITGATAWSIPRDLLVTDGQGRLLRLALSLQLGGEQSLVDGLCETLAISTDHLVIVDFRGLVEIVDALDGVTVDVRYPMRDLSSGLDIGRAGSIRLDGVQALAFARSRHAEHLIESTWVEEPDGALGRATRLATLLNAVQTSAQETIYHPFQVQQLLWRATGDVTSDADTNLVDLIRLGLTDPSTKVLPSEPVAGSIAVAPSPATHQALTAAGFEESCTPAPQE